MPNVTGLSFDIKAIKQADEAIKELVTNGQKGVGNLNKAWKDMTKDGLNHFIERLRAAQKDIAKLSSAQIKVTVSGQADDLKRLGASAEKAVPQVNRLLTAMQQLSAIHVNTVGGGGVSVMDAQKINYLQQQIKLLQDQLKIQQEIGQAVERQATSTSRVRNGMSGIEDAARKVRQIAGTLFSIQALSGYVNKLVAVRGEFELQQRALQAIVQNIDEANKLWEKTVALAVQSPFRVRELVTYTKQLAAYRVETEKLYDTTKMLADVSAGLGVDMNRLILAFGQVKAANFLRGTELRQFSEAGINILGELATYFTELEGRVVTVGDVFERVSKRMVSFTDVEEIFKRITSEGGAFFNMQEIQAETLKGQIANLKDSIDLMLNDIGKANEKTIKNMVAFTRTLVEGWRFVGGMLSSLGSALTVVAIARAKDALATNLWSKANIAATAAGKGFTATVAKMIMGLKGLWAAMLNNPITATYAALAAIGTVIYKVVKRQRELNREYEESVGKIHAQYIETKKYADSIKELVERQNELIEANKNLSQDSNEYKENQQEISDIEERRKEVIKELIKIDPDYAKSIQNAGRDLNVLIPLAEEYNEKLRARLGLESSLKDINVDESSEKYNNAATEQRAALGNLEKTRNILLKQAKELLTSDTLYESERKALEEFVNGSEPYYKRAIKLREDLQKVFIDLGTTEQAYGLGTRTVKKTGISTLWQKLDFESRDSIEKYIKALDKLSRKEKKVVEDMSTVAEEFRGLEMGARLTSIIADENATQEDKDKAKNKIIDFFEEVLNEKGIVGAIADKARSLWSSLFNIDWKKVPIPTKLTGWRAAYDEFLKTLSTDAVPSITEEEDESDYIETLKRTYESYAKDIEGWDAKNAKLRAQYSKDEIDVIRLQNEERKKALDWLVYEKDNSADSGENEELKRLNERIRLVRELRKEYEDLNKTFGDVESEERVRNSYREAWESIMPEDMSIDLFDFTDPKGVVKQLEELKTKLSPEAIDLIKTIQKAIAGESVEIDVNFKKGKDKELLDDIQELFDQYDLSLELKKLNIPSDLAKSLFNVDYLDLEGLKKAVQEQREAFVGKDMLEEYDDLMKKIGELSRKQREDEAKEFINFLKKNLNEIQIIQDKGAYNIALADRLFGEGKITAEQYMSSIRQIVEDTNKEVAKVNLDKFKDSATYIKAMGNLAAYSRDELEGMISALQEQVGANAGNMGADEIRAYYEALERLVKQYDKIESPFQKGEINDLIEYIGLQKQLNQEKEKEAALEQRKAEINNRLNLLQAQLKSQQERGDVLGAASTQRQIKSAVGELKEVDGELVSVTSNISVISEKVANLGDGMIKSLVVAQKIVNEIANVANASTKIFDDIKSAADALGADTESGGWAKAGYAMEMVGGVSSELTSGLANLASGNFAGALANVVGMVTKLISGFAKIHDQNYQDIIEAQAKQVERLGKAYEKLETDTENAYSIQQLQQYNEELERNVELQIASYKAMIAAENAKKNTDTEQIEAWNEEIEALTQQWDELKQSLVEGVGGVSDYRSQTREFVDSWVSAFKETGDGLSGLKENFREFFDNIIAEQAALRVTEKFLTPFYDSLNSALDDLSLSVEESKNLREEADRIMPQLSEALELIWNQLGGGRAEGESGGLSALQKGIQGITEDTAQVIEAYLNSVRGYVSEQVTYTKRLYEMFDRMSHGTTYGLNVRMIS